MTQVSKAGLLIAKIHHISGRIMNELHKELSLDKLNSAQGRILFELLQEDNINIQELASQTALTKSTLTSMLKTLEKKGFVKRTRGREDERMVFVELIIDDEQFFENYRHLIETLSQIYFSGFSQREIEFFESQLSQILINLQNYEARETKE